MKVDIIGCVHANRDSCVRKSFADITDDVDAVFIEQARIGEQFLDVLNMTVRFPAVLLGFLLQTLLIQGPLLALFNQRLRSTEYIVAEEMIDEKPIHLVGKHPLFILLERSSIWIIANWFLVSGMILIFPTALFRIAVICFVFGLGSHIAQNKVGYGVPAVVLAMAGGVILIYEIAIRNASLYIIIALWTASTGVFAVTLAQRNEQMLVGLKATMIKEGYDEVCLATGKAHVEGMVDEAMDRNLVVGDVFRQRWLRQGTTIEVNSESGSQSE